MDALETDVAQICRILKFQITKNVVQGQVAMSYALQTTYTHHSASITQDW